MVIRIASESGQSYRPICLSALLSTAAQHWPGDRSGRVAFGSYALGGAQSSATKAILSQSPRASSFGQGRGCRVKTRREQQEIDLKAATEPVRDSRGPETQKASCFRTPSGLLAHRGGKPQAPGLRIKVEYHLAEYYFTDGRGNAVGVEAQSRSSLAVRKAAVESEPVQQYDTVKLKWTARAASEGPGRDSDGRARRVDLGADPR